MNEDILALVVSLLESGSWEGCEDCVVVGYSEFYKVREALFKKKGSYFGPEEPESKMKEEDDE